jgi:hypothetical protein
MEKFSEKDLNTVIYLSSLQDPELIDYDDIDEALTFEDGDAILTADEAISLTDRSGNLDPRLVGEINRQRFVLMEIIPVPTAGIIDFDLVGRAFIDAINDKTIVIKRKLLPLLADAYWTDAVEEAEYIRSREGDCANEDNLNDLHVIHQELNDSKLRISMSLLQRQRILDYIDLQAS